MKSIDELESYSAYFSDFIKSNITNEENATKSRVTVVPSILLLKKKKYLKEI
jgi:hypothetical protein